MVLQRRLEYGFNGYQVPATPRATRSARRRSSFKKKVEDNQMCAFDLLATVAGKLLQEKESSPTSSNMSSDKDQCAVVKNIVKKEWQGEDKLVKLETCDQGSCDRRYFACETVSHAHQNHTYRESPSPQTDVHLGFTSVITTSDCSDRLDTQNLVNGKTKNELGSFDSKVEVGPSAYIESGACNKPDDDAKVIMKDEPHDAVKVLYGSDACSLGDPMVWDGKSPALVSLDSSMKAPVCGDSIPQSSYPASQDYVKIVSKDDDENSSGCTHRSTTKKSFRSAPRIGDRRIRKILASKYWKVAPKLKDETPSTTDVDFKPAYCNRKTSYKRLRSERNYPFKKRKFFHCFSVSNSDGGISSEAISDSPEKGISGDDSSSCPRMLGATGGSSSVPAQHSSFQSRESHVKLRIKSLRVPELFIEIPETATVGSLKRTVMEAVTAILGGGLHVGVLLQGRKVRDDNKTLLQTGISQDNHSDALGFCLEPNPSQTAPTLRPEESPSLLPYGTPQPLSRYPPAPVAVQQGACHAFSEPHGANAGILIESDHDSAPSPIDRLAGKSTMDSRALVPIPAMNDALAIVPVHRKSKRSEVAQRRIRRPFSVAEVEALVQAVEKLGTGRWRDVKLRAFDNAKHRTYVDLKDKWKTLVHTARISPQQRRGEPVPQELLDRVLTAHAYWSQQQAKQQLKQQQHQQQQHQPETCLLL